MKNWKILLGVLVLILIASRGGMPVIFTLGKLALPVVLFYFAVKHITLALFPDRKDKDKLKSKKSADHVIRICADCGKEEHSCLKCRLGFKS